MSALNGTYEKKGWANILELIPLCEKVKKLSAICKICATNANYTFRTCAGQDQARRWSVEQICTCPYAENALMRRPSSKPWPSKFCTPRVKALALMMAWLQSISWSTCVNLIWAAAILKLLTHLPPRIQLSPRMSWIANKNQTRSRRATLSSSIITPGSKQPKMKAWETET